MTSDDVKLSDIQKPRRMIYYEIKQYQACSGRIELRVRTKGPKNALGRCVKVTFLTSPKNIFQKFWIITKKSLVRMAVCVMVGGIDLQDPPP